MSNTSLAATAALLLGALATPAHAEWALNMPVGVTELSKKIYGLHMIIFYWCVAIGIVVFGWMIYSLLKFRRSQGAKADTSITHSTKAEIIWTVIPIGILVLMAVPSARTLIAIEDMTNGELEVKATGYQWKWEYEYLDKGVSFFSTISRDSDAARQLGSGLDPNKVPNYLLDVDNPLVVPVGTKVIVHLTAQDVIHAWWVPALGMKKDAVPGSISSIWFKVDADKPGLYRGQCAELCGRDHGFMPIVVDARPKADFEAWLAGKRAAQQQAAGGAETVPATAQAKPAAASAG